MKCKICDKKIPAKRLEALPKTELCVKCSEKHPENNDKNHAMIYHTFFS